MIYESELLMETQHGQLVMLELTNIRWLKVLLAVFVFIFGSGVLWAVFVFVFGL